MPAACIIREAHREDMDALTELLGMLFTLETDFAAGAQDAVRQKSGLELMLLGTQRLVLVAEDKGSVAGMATAQLVVSTAEGGPSLLIEDVIVRPEAHGRGIGRALLARLEAWGVGLGATRLQLLADRDNTTALDFYRACGFASTNLVCLRRSLPPAAGK